MALAVVILCLLVAASGVEVSIWLSFLGPATAEEDDDATLVTHAKDDAPPEKDTCSTQRGRTSCCADDGGPAPTPRLPWRAVADVIVFVAFQAAVVVAGRARPLVAAAADVVCTETTALLVALPIAAYTVGFHHGRAPVIATYDAVSRDAQLECERLGADGVDAPRGSGSSFATTIAVDTAPAAPPRPAFLQAASSRSKLRRSSSHGALAGRVRKPRQHHHAAARGALP